MEDDVKSGHKRKQDKVKSRKQKVSRGKTEGSIDTLLLYHSSTDSDHTVVSCLNRVLVPDTPVKLAPVSVSSSGEVPDNPTSVPTENKYIDSLCPEMRAIIDGFFG
ncbi:hypothetical protein AVEN_209513-1 [Araneus ventricosus]|uniref:Uncharacterized protein n=1 Tax=Araneus ventricosus TaxID=182803 RepID=A0A4Y2IQL4_ARAVE|nr:hypothetical protein AVEN_209513-1 [Araneus ventricosus]